MTESFDAGPAGRLLAAAWKSGMQIAELPAEVRPRTLKQGYDVQDAFITAVGDPVIGWKLGMGSPNGMRLTGLGRPLAGRVLKSACFQSGDVVKISNAAPIVIEFEVAFVLERDVAPGTAPHAPLESVSTTRVTFELLQSRFVDRRAVGWPSFAADNGVFRALVVGPVIAQESMHTLGTDVVVQVNGRDTARGLAGDDRTDAVASLGALFAHAAERGMTLHKGDIISTGAVSQPFELAGSNHVVTMAAGLKLEVRIEG
ncbi:MAG: fumarylacetoacetate hydrolase family protein [Casimicrobiaceae bacterium]